MVEQTGDWVGMKLAEDRYEVRSVLGEGGMGLVYAARDHRLGNDVVVKVPHRHILATSGFADRFRQEIRSLVDLSHPHIVRVIDVGEHEELPFAVMQYLAGGSLADRRPRAPDGRARPMSVGSLRQWLTEVASTLDFMHGQGYVHRDVKPGNILFDSHGNVFLSDFGVAKVHSAAAAELQHTATGIALGTPHYMAPELIMGKKYGGEVDQYALGVLVHELLAGRVPFHGKTAAAVLVEHSTKQPPPLHQLNSSLPQPVSFAVLKALEKDPARRFHNCGAFARALLADVSSRKTAASGTNIACPNCEKTLRVPTNLAGANVRCTACSATLVVTEDAKALSVVEPKQVPTTPPVTQPSPTPTEPYGEVGAPDADTDTGGGSETVAPKPFEIDKRNAGWLPPTSVLVFALVLATVANTNLVNTGGLHFTVGAIWSALLLTLVLGMSLFTAQRPDKIDARLAFAAGVIVVLEWLLGKDRFVFQPLLTNAINISMTSGSFLFGAIAFSRISRWEASQTRLPMPIKSTAGLLVGGGIALAFLADSSRIGLPTSLPVVIKFYILHGLMVAGIATLLGVVVRDAKSAGRPTMNSGLVGGSKSARRLPQGEEHPISRPLQICAATIVALGLIAFIASGWLNGPFERLFPRLYLVYTCSGVTLAIATLVTVPLIGSGIHPQNSRLKIMILVAAGTVGMALAWQSADPQNRVFFSHFASTALRCSIVGLLLILGVPMVTSSGADLRSTQHKLDTLLAGAAILSVLVMYMTVG